MGPVMKAGCGLAAIVKSRLNAFVSWLPMKIDVLERWPRGQFATSSFASKKLTHNEDVVSLFVS